MWIGAAKRRNKKSQNDYDVIYVVRWAGEETRNAFISTLFVGRKEESKYLRYISNTRRFSRGATAFVLAARHVNTEYKSCLCSDGHSRRFSMMLPELCSYSSSTRLPFMNQETSGWGRPENTKNKEKLISWLTDNNEEQLMLTPKPVFGEGINWGWSFYHFEGFIVDNVMNKVNVEKGTFAGLCIRCWLTQFLTS